MRDPRDARENLFSPLVCFDSRRMIASLDQIQDLPGSRLSVLSILKLENLENHLANIRVSISVQRKEAGLVLEVSGVRPI